MKQEWLEGHKARKRFGQNFLHDRHWIERIVRGIDPKPGDALIEIGPGQAALTREVIACAGHEAAVEIDRDLAQFLREQFSPEELTLIEADALKLDWTTVLEGRRLRIIGNLPYNVASPMMWDLFSRATGLVRAAFMVQKEVGQRLAAGPGNGHYGALSVWVQSFARPRMEFIVGPGAFSPPPKVDSAVLSFEPLPLDQRPERPDLLALVIKVCFQQRRKQLGSIARRCPLAPWLSAAIEQAGITPTLRPEQLTVADFQHISRFGASLLDNPLKN